MLRTTEGEERAPLDALLNSMTESFDKVLQQPEISKATIKYVQKATNLN